MARDDDREPWPSDAVEVGRILGAWGIKGALKIKPHAAAPQGLFASKRWYLGAPEAPRQGAPFRTNPATTWPQPLRIVHAREHGEWIVATAHDVEDREQAQAMAGARVHVSRASFPTPEPDEYYWVDLIGLDVVNRQGQSLGRVENLHETGPHCVLQLGATQADGAMRMIPFVSAYIDRVDLAERRIVADWGLEY